MRPAVAVVLVVAAVRAVLAHGVPSAPAGLEWHVGVDRRTAAAREGWKCGSNSPELDDFAAPIVAQQYVQQRAAAPKRRLQTSYMTIEDAHTNGFTRSLRIVPIWEVIEGPEPGQQCVSDNDVVGAGTQCTPRDVLLPGSDKAEQLRSRVQWAAEYYRQLLYVKPVTDDIVIPSSLRSAFPGAPVSVSNADLVVIMTGRPSPDGSVAAFASCQQRDQHGRCTVGWFNWSPAHVDAAHTTDASVVAAERDTAVHELAHLLGAVKPSPVFVDDAGNSIIQSSLSQGEGRVFVVDNGAGGTPGAVYFNKATTWITTPRVQAVVRRHFGCPTLVGMPLEDVPLAGGAGSHWEARVAGSEIMSYGGASGEVIMSELTLAFLEDTEQYRANYTMAGPLLDSAGDGAACGSTGNTAVFDFVFGNQDTDHTPVTPVTRPLGQLRWGRDAGCGFVVGSPAEWTARYRCTVNRDLGCTADNRMSAVCSIQSDWTLPPTAVSQGDIRSASPTLAHDDCPTGTSCPLPTMFRYFTDEAGVSVPRMGGYSQSMDFAPVRIGYWNCQHTSAQLAGFDVGEDGAAVNFTEQGYDAAVEDTGLFGGQCRCKQCRCFQSSLREVTGVSFDPRFQRYGLCYRSNCYRRNYLQVAIRDPFTASLRWYRCTDAGGKVYIPGFSGAFHCPNATEFCAFEDITGVRHPEVQPWQLWVVLALGLGLPLAALVGCLFPCCREPVVRCLKRCCGVTLLARKKTVWVEEGVSPSAGHPMAVHATRGVSSPSAGRIVVGTDREEVTLKATCVVRRVRPPRTPGTVLIVVNLLLVAVEVAVIVALLVMMSNHQLALSSTPLLMASLFVAGVTASGLAGARKRARGLSCLIVAYFYGAVLTVATVLLAVVCAVVVNQDLEAAVDSNWDVFEDVYQGQYDADDPRQAQVEDVAEHIRQQAAAYLAAVVVFVALMTTGAVAAGRIMRTRNVAVVTFCVLNNVLAVVGVLFVVAGVLMATTPTLGALSTLEPIIGSIITSTFVAGVVLAVVGVLGVRAAHQAHRKSLAFHAVVSLCCLVVSAIGSGVAASNASRAARTVDSLNEDDLAMLETQRTPEQLTADVRGFYTAVSITCGVVAALWLASLVTQGLYARALGLWLATGKSKEAGRQLQHRARNRPNTADHRRAMNMLSSVVPIVPSPVAGYKQVPTDTPSRAVLPRRQLSRSPDLPNPLAIPAAAPPTALTERQRRR